MEFCYRTPVALTKPILADFGRRKQQVNGDENMTGMTGSARTVPCRKKRRSSQRLSMASRMTGCSITSESGLRTTARVSDLFMTISGLSRWMKAGEISSIS